MVKFIGILANYLGPITPGHQCPRLYMPLVRGVFCPADTAKPGCPYLEFKITCKAHCIGEGVLYQQA
jgi:hypothetical protein